MLVSHGGGLCAESAAPGAVVSSVGHCHEEGIEGDGGALPKMGSTFANVANGVAAEVAACGKYSVTPSALLRSNARALLRGTSLAADATGDVVRGDAVRLLKAHVTSVSYRIVCCGAPTAAGF